jgi:hypothetical protein
MWAALGASLLALFKAMIPFLWDKSNEARTARDVSPVPDNIRRSWLDRVRKFKERIRP